MPFKSAEDEVQGRAKVLFVEIADRHDIEVNALEVVSDEAPVCVFFVSALHAKGIGRLKAIWAELPFEEFSELVRERYGNHHLETMHAIERHR